MKYSVSNIEKFVLPAFENLIDKDFNLRVPLDEFLSYCVLSTTNGNYAFDYKIDGEIYNFDLDLPIIGTRFTLLKNNKPFCLVQYDDITHCINDEQLSDINECYSIQLIDNCNDDDLSVVHELLEQIDNSDDFNIPSILVYTLDDVLNEWNIEPEAVN